MASTGKDCFLDKDRQCDATCAAYNEKNQDCKLLERSAIASRSFKTLMHWLRQGDVPSI